MRVHVRAFFCACPRVFSSHPFPPQDGAATNPDFSVLAHAAWQVKQALEATHLLGGANYVLWGGREG